MSGVTLDQVDDQIGRGFRFLRFRRPVELAFLQDYVAHRISHTVIWAIIGIVIYDMVYFGDGTMMPDVFSQLIVVRFLVFTPFVIASVLAVRRWPSALAYDILAISIAVLGVTLPMAVAIHSKSQYLFEYQNGNVAAFLFFVIALRPRFAAIVAGLVLMCASHFTTASLSGAFDPVTFTGIVSFYITVSIFLAMSAYFMEHKDRLNFLNHLRGGLLHDELQRNAERDELTGLLNRRSLARLRETIWNGEPTQSVSAVMLDIDHFKPFNDLHGHVEGDSCIRLVSRCISDHVDGSCLVFRYGGEEILILMTDADQFRAFAMAERIRAAIEALRIDHKGAVDGHFVTASLGVASGRTGDCTLEDLVKQADDALYEAKRRGRNIVALADTASAETPAAPNDNLAAVRFAKAV